MSDEPKFCKDCRYYSTDRQWQHCSHIRIRNRVSGEPGFADIQRAYDTAECGTPGRLWKPKEVAPPAPRRKPRWWEFWK